ncbi:2Fe-2S iron-sulfur cluster-binding protein [Roseivirga pacifica]|uniref:2Fe-2S iron-sulfur cluster-binding protein n=1 Tax=Roseivirga pacifica TaxID=1267423 RepID=UPI003BA89B64|tara:strand:- start:73 stop:393 length:321 start_codon:yes stop_codon:yes gene_type:complete
MVNITVEDKNGTRQDLELPTDMGLSLMEVLKASEYNILATCGGMALCATCHVEVLEGADKLPELNDPEYDMLDTLPDATPDSRLACQLRISDEMEGMLVRLMAEED